MSTRGDFEVFNEPFSRGYYFGPNRKNDRYDPEPPCEAHDPEKVLAELREASRQCPVFFKDMAYHVRSFLDWSFLKNFRNAVLIRDPRLALASLHRKLPDFTREETGYEAVTELVNLIQANTGSAPYVMDGEALRADPEAVGREFCDALQIPFRPESLSWPQGNEAHWQNWQEWFAEAAQSTGFRAPEASFDHETLAQPGVASALEYCMPCYEALSAYRRQSPDCS